MNRGRFETNRIQAQQYVSETREKATMSIRGNVKKIDFHPEDLMKPPTLITGFGFYSVLKGARNGNITTVDGVHDIRNGRALDIADGIVARKFGMESDAGALADVTADKLEQLIIAVEAWKHDALPKSVISYLVVKNIAHTLLTIAASISHPGESITTPKANKYAMLLENLGAGLLLEANAYESEQPEGGKHATRKKLGAALLGASLLFELSALKTMVERLDEDTLLS